MLRFVGVAALTGALPALLCPLCLPGATLVTGCAPELGTVGAVLGQKPDGRLFVRETPPSLAAARQGLAPGDEILLIDGKDVRQMGERELYASLSGDVGTSVNLTVARGENVMRVRLVRTPAARATVGAGHAHEE